MTPRELSVLRDKVARARMDTPPDPPIQRPKPPRKARVIPAEQGGQSPRRYPVTGPASILECPVHLLVVALDASGRVASACLGCRLEAEAGIRLLEARG